VGRKAGLSDEKLRAVLGQDMTAFNDTERLVIELADAMTDTPSNVSDDLYARLRNQFSEEQLMQLGGQIAFENYRARWNRIFNVESDNLYTPNADQSQESRSALKARCGSNYCKKVPFPFDSSSTLRLFRGARWKRQQVGSPSMR
jgi:hypothetical protein